MFELSHGCSWLGTVTQHTHYSLQGNHPCVGLGYSDAQQRIRMKATYELRLHWNSESNL
jgi:hypothetical protein